MATPTFILSTAQMERAYAGIRSVASELKIDGAYGGFVQKLAENLSDRGGLHALDKIGARNLTIRDVVNLRLTETTGTADNAGEAFVVLDRNTNMRGILDKPISQLTTEDVKDVKKIPHGNALLLHAAAAKAIVTARKLVADIRTGRNVPYSDPEQPQPRP